MNTVIHIGTHKTGTKTLQRNLFSNLRGRRYISEPFPVAPKLEELFDRIKYQDSLSFDPLCAEELVRDLHGEGVLGTDESPVVISDEVFVTPFLGRGRTADPGIIAERLLTYIGPAKILFVIRSQPSLLPSLYSQFIPRNRRTLNQKLFEERIKLSMNDQLHGMLHALRYDRLANRYADLFGEENLKIIPFEILERDPARYYRSVCEFIDEPFDESISEFYKARENKRRGKGEVWWDRCVPIYERAREKYNLPRPSEVWPSFKASSVNKFVSSYIGSKPYPLRVPDNFQDMLRKFYGPSNRRLNDRFCLALEEFGYPMLSPSEDPGDEDEGVGLGGWTLVRF